MKHKIWIYDNIAKQLKFSNKYIPKEFYLRWENYDTMAKTMILWEKKL